MVSTILILISIILKVLARTVTVDTERHRIYTGKENIRLFPLLYDLIL